MRTISSATIGDISKLKDMEYQSQIRKAKLVIDENKLLILGSVIEDSCGSVREIAILHNKSYRLQLH